jgi:hypothetical protein
LCHRDKRRAAAGPGWFPKPGGLPEPRNGRRPPELRRGSRHFRLPCGACPHGPWFLIGW